MSAREAQGAVRGRSSRPFVRVLVIETEGSAPREAGAEMRVFTDGFAGTIGGGALEHEAMAAASHLLAHAPSTRWLRREITFPLGPALGQCCGGVVRLLLERGPDGEVMAPNAPSTTAPGATIAAASAGAARVTRLDGDDPPRLVRNRSEAGGLPPPVDRQLAAILSGEHAATIRRIRTPRDGTWLIEPAQRPRATLMLYGAGHVGRAIVRVLEGLDFDIHWVDTGPERFPEPLPAHATPIVAPDPAAIARDAPPGAFHLVLTYSHAIDLAVCHAVLAGGDFGFLGLIGSASKRARFVSRLKAAGIGGDVLDRLVSPIGIGAIRDKSPAAIAISVAAQLLALGERAGSGARAMPQNEPLQRHAFGSADA